MAGLSGFFKRPEGRTLSRMVFYQQAAGMGSRAREWTQSPAERKRGAGPGAAGMRRGPFDKPKSKSTFKGIQSLLKDINRGEPKPGRRGEQKPGTTGEPKFGRRGKPGAQLARGDLRPLGPDKKFSNLPVDDPLAAMRSRLPKHWEEQWRARARYIYRGMRALGEEGTVEELHRLLGRRVVDRNGIVHVVTPKGLFKVGRMGRSELDGLTRRATSASREAYTILHRGERRLGGFGAWSRAVDDRAAGREPQFVGRQGERALRMTGAEARIIRANAAAPGVMPGDPALDRPFALAQPPATRSRRPTSPHADMRRRPQ